MPALQASTSHPYSLLRRESKPPMTALYRTVLSLGALSLLCASCPAHADTFFGTDTTVNFAVSGNAILGFASQTDFTNGTNPSSPTVGFAAGGSVTTTSTTTLYHGSTLNVNGGRLSNFVYVFDSGHANVISGNIAGNLLGYNTSALSISGGSIGLSLQIHDTGVAAISGGTIGKPNAGGVVGLITLR